MGQHADDYTAMCIDHEAEWDDYFAGNMSDGEAYDKGILNHQGYADIDQLNRVIDRNEIGNLESLNNQLSHAYKDLTIGSSSTGSTSGSSDGYTSSTGSRGSLKDTLNEAAINNLSKPRPTCNWCDEMMTARNGRYGKFYFCECPEQVTVSDKYWQSIRRVTKKPKISLQEWQARLKV